MEHASDMELIELVAGRLPPERRDAVEAHLALCGECRRRRDATAEVWQVLGEWEVTAGGRDLSSAVVAAAQRQAAHRSWRHRAQIVLRAAAAVAIGAGIGHLAGRLARPAAIDPGGEAVLATVDEEAAARALSLSVFEQAAPAGLADAVLGVVPEGEEEAS